MNKLTRQAIVWGNTPLKIHDHHSLAVVTWNVTRRTAGLHRKCRGVARQRSKHVSSCLGTRLVWNVWQDHRLQQKLKQKQTAMTKAVSIRLCLKEGLFGQLDLQTWQTEARRILAALVAMPQLVVSSSCLGLKDKKSRLEALVLKQSLVVCHSAAQLGDVAATGFGIARVPWKLFVRHVFRRKLMTRLQV